ncbi:uncharacterized protein LOC131620817 isoform X2 [Vicia villosa]|uniref:uncharacterized protein LOC131620817 isoform X2 n=1 Tax=Vicia villosa TaxID=3911 RepID=UPI00273C23FF|nr:uncharacterized protein LOC131620817 isoform X2 [Vicia villosa]
MSLINSNLNLIYINIQPNINTHKPSIFINMTKPSNFLHKPSPIIEQRQENKNMMCLDKQLQRQLSNNISNEDYHGNKFASIPFVWESQPGTPKHRSNAHSLPPLTPPPSYFQNASKKPTKPKKNFFLQTFFPKRASKKSCDLDPSPTSSNFVSYSSSSSSSSLSLSSPRPTSYSVPCSPMIHSRKGEEDEDLYDVSRSDVCFGNVRSQGRYSSMFKKG